MSLTPLNEYILGLVSGWRANQNRVVIPFEELKGFLASRCRIATVVRNLRPNGTPDTVFFAVSSPLLPGYCAVETNLGAAAILRTFTPECTLSGVELETIGVEFETTKLETLVAQVENRAAVTASERHKKDREERCQKVNYTIARVSAGLTEEVISILKKDHALAWRDNVMDLEKPMELIGTFQIDTRIFRLKIDWVPDNLKIYGPFILTLVEVVPAGGVEIPVYPLGYAHFDSEYGHLRELFLQHLKIAFP